jgi:hypothetical protein
MIDIPSGLTPEGSLVLPGSASSSARFDAVPSTDAIGVASLLHVVDVSDLARA